MLSVESKRPQSLCLGERETVENVWMPPRGTGNVPAPEGLSFAGLSERRHRKQPEELGTDRTVSALCPKPGSLAETGFWGWGHVTRYRWGRLCSLRTRPAGSVARQYKIVLGGTSRLLNYSFGSAARWLCCPHSPAASLKLM